jgi:hypothetical protein
MPKEYANDAPAIGSGYLSMDASKRAVLHAKCIGNSVAAVQQKLSHKSGE